MRSQKLDLARLEKLNNLGLTLILDPPKIKIIKKQVQIKKSIKLILTKIKMRVITYLKKVTTANRVRKMAQKNT